MQEQIKRLCQKSFCGAYLRTMDPEKAAREAGYRDGFALLARKPVRRQLERMRGAAADQIRREDVLRRLAKLAFGQANDALQMAVSPEQTNLEQLDLSAVAEFKVTDKGSVEIKLVDRIRALETLFRMLEEGRESGTAELCQMLSEVVGEEGGWEHG